MPNLIEERLGVGGATRPMASARWIRLAELEERQMEWRELAAGSEFPNVFADPRWILPWWKHYGDSHEPWSLALEDGAGSLRGLALLGCSKSPFLRTLTFAGERWNGLDTLPCAPGAEAELVPALMSALSERRREWDIWRIGRLPTESSLARSLLGGGGELRAAAHDLRAQPFLELPADTDAFEAALNIKHRREYQRKWRRLVEMGAQPRLVTDADEVGGVIATLLELRRSRAIAMDQSHAHLDTRFESFIGDVVRGLLPESARLWTMELAGRTLTTRLSLIEGSREHGYLVGFSGEHHSLSPGRALERHAFLAMIAEGRRELDLGAGRDEYKYTWGATDRELAHVVVISPSGRGRLAGTPAAIDLRLRDTAAAEALRRRRGIAGQRVASGRSGQESVPVP